MTTPLDAILSRQSSGETRLKLWDELVKYARELERDAERIDWLERWHTLHWSVEVTYVVDGYQVRLCHDGNERHLPFHGEEFRDAIDTAMALTPKEPT